MKPNNKPNENELVTQEHCIDLPGETVQCWIGGNTDKLKVILRKHRDVVFDIHLGNEQSYTLEATESDFYNPRDKKLVYAARHGKVAFKDGERMHIWISRGFRGALILNAAITSYQKFGQMIGINNTTATTQKKSLLLSLSQSHPLQQVRSQRQLHDHQMAQLCSRKNKLYKCMKCRKSAPHPPF